MTHKTIMYVSESTARKSSGGVPADVSNIYMEARRKNRDNKIHGVISYHAGYFVQILEGEDHALNDLYVSIKNDARHTNIVTILDCEAGVTFFTDWNMRSVRYQTNAEVQRYLAYYQASLESLDARRKKSLSIFFDAYNIKKQQPKSRHSYRGKALAITNWPDFTKIEQSDNVIALSAVLVTGPVEYEYLADKIGLDSFGTLDEMLHSLELQGILQLTSASSSKKRVPSIKTTNNNNLYQRVRAFLRG